MAVDLISPQRDPLVLARGRAGVPGCLVLHVKRYVVAAVANASRHPGIPGLVAADRIARGADIRGACLA
jgi:hypothetical protein